MLALLLGASLAVAACSTSDDAERLAAQRFFRNYLLQQDATAAADVRIQGFVDTLPPDFPLAAGLQLLGSAFTDTDTQRELIVGWDSASPADDLYDFYARTLDRAPWSIERDPRLAGVDFLSFRDADDPTFEGELRIAQEGDRAVVVLIARNALPTRGDDAVPTAPGAS